MNNLSRRSFVTKSALVATALGASTLKRPQCAELANGKLNIGVVGAGGMGSYATKTSATENLVAICDVDRGRAGNAYRDNPKAAEFQDFRVMLDKMDKEIDAVCISTPDHTHFPIALAAMERGKHVFVQKPLAHNIWQVRTLQKAMHKYNVVTQMGNQGHLFSGMNRIKEWVDGGIIGEVKRIDAWTNRPLMPYFKKPSQIPPKPETPPSDLNWDLWLGPTKERPYSKEYLPLLWRDWWNFGCASLGDIGCHTFDAPFYTLDLGYPTKVEVEISDDAKGSEQYMPWGTKTIFHFPARGNHPPRGVELV
jgi:hypothetical protein